MDKIKYVVVCKKGYMFTTDKEEIKKFIEEQGRNIAYYVGYFKPIENLDFIQGLDTSLEKLGKVKVNTEK